jgi:hypothetical protein
MIEKELSPTFLGALGGLKSKEVIDSERKKDTNSSKFLRFFKIKEK